MAETTDSSKNRKPSKFKGSFLVWLVRTVLKFGPKAYTAYKSVKRLIELYQEYFG